MKTDMQKEILFYFEDENKMSSGKITKRNRQTFGMEKWERVVILDPKKIFWGWVGLIS